MPDPRIFPITSSNETGVAVTNVSTLVLAANANRQDADFVNDGAYVVYLARGNAAVIGAGQRLNPYGGSYHIETENLWEGVVNAIADCDEQEEGNLSVAEGVRP